MVVFVLKQLRDLCVYKATYLQVQTANNNPNISQAMRFAQLSTATDARGHKRTVTDINKIPIEMRPKPSIIVPLTNF